MKNRILFSLLTAGILLSGCSKSEHVEGPGTVPGDGQSVAIRLSSGIGTPSKAGTKAPVTANAPATVQIEGWESSTGTPDYTKATSDWQSTADVKVQTQEEIEADEMANDITLSPVQYYNADGNTKTYIRGWYPAAKSANGTVTFSAEEDADKGYDFAGDGTDDVLLSNEVFGDKINEVGEALVFDHVTAQLIFKVVKGEGLAAGTQIKTIKVKNTAVPTSITLGNVTDGADATVVNYTDKSELEVPNIEVAEIGQTAEAAGDPLMVKPVDDNTTVTLYIETVKEDGTTTAAIYDDVALTTSDGKLTQGAAYTVTLTFKQAGISLEANITPWTEATGEGEVI